MSDEIMEVKKAVDGLNEGMIALREANDASLAEIKANGVADPVTLAKIDKIEGTLDTLQKTVDTDLLKRKRAERVVTDANGVAVDLDAKALHWAKGIAKKRGTSVPEFDAEGMNAYKAAFEKYMRKEDFHLTDMDRKALSVGVDADGGYIVNPDLGGRWIEQVYESSPMRAYASAQMISTNELQGVYDLDETAAGWVAETDARPVTATPQFAKWSIFAHELYDNPSATQQMLDDAEVNIESWLMMKTAAKFGRMESTAFVKGDGVGKPKGFLDYAAGSTLTSEIEQIKTGVDGDLAAVPGGGDALIDTAYALKTPYRANATWFLNRASLKMVRKATDNDGAYLWQAGIAAGQPATILGYPMASFEDMPDPAAGSLSIAFGDMRQAYQIVDRMGIRVIRDPFSAKPNVSFYSTKRVGGAVVNFEALKIIDFSA